MEEDGVKVWKAKDGGSSALQRAGRLKLELRCMATPPTPQQPTRWTLPPLWHRLFSTAVHTREPCGRQLERKEPRSSEQDSERHCLLLGGAVECEEAESLSCSSCSRLVMALEVEPPPPLLSQSQWPELRCISGRTSHRLSRLVPTGRGWRVQSWVPPPPRHRLDSAAAEHSDFDQFSEFTE